MSMKTAVLTRLAQFSDSFGVYVMNSLDPSGYMSFVKVSTVDELRVMLMSPNNPNPRMPGWRTDSAFDPTVDAPLSRKKRKKRKSVKTKVKQIKRFVRRKKGRK